MVPLIQIKHVPPSLKQINQFCPEYSIDIPPLLTIQPSLQGVDNGRKLTFSILSFLGVLAIKWNSCEEMTGTQFIRTNLPDYATVRQHGM